MGTLMAQAQTLDHQLKDTEFELFKIFKKKIHL